MAGKKVNRLIVPNVYTVNGVEPVMSVNNILPVNGNVTLPIPTVPTNVSAFTNDAGYLTSATLDGYATQSWVQQQGYLTSVPSQYITDTELSTTLADYVTSSSLSTTLNSYATVTGLSTETSDRMDADDSLQLQINDKYDASNPDGFISGISRSDVITALGYTPYNSSNPNGYITSAALSDYVTNTDLSTTLADYAQTTDIPTVGNGTITINQGGVQKGTFTVNQSGNSTINLDAGGSSGTVDQTYDSTSANAQSGVAIAGAGFLTNITYSNVITALGYTPLENTAIASTSLALLGSAALNNAITLGNDATTSANRAIAIGYSANASGTATVAIGSSASATDSSASAFGNKAKATSAYSTALGAHAEATEDNAIQIGYGTNNTRYSLQVSFGTGAGSASNNYLLLDGLSGLIPDARISSNIARVSNIPTVPTSISAFTNDVGYTTNVGTVTSVNNSQPDANGNVTLSIPTVPTNVSAFTNDSGYITGITSNDVTDALGYTPYNSTNPNGYQTSSDVNTTVTNAISTLLGNIYPVGSVYIGTQSTCPLATLISGSTWELVAEDRVLQGSSTNHSANTTVAAGLPNITGGIASRPLSTQYTGAITGASGAFTYTRNGASGTLSPVSVTGTAVKGDMTQFNASHSSSVYGNSTTVQPPAYVVNIWRRTA